MRQSDDTRSGISRASEPSTKARWGRKGARTKVRRKVETTVALGRQNGRRRIEPLSGPAGKIGSESLRAAYLLPYWGTRSSAVLSAHAVRNINSNSLRICWRHTAHVHASRPRSASFPLLAFFRHADHTHTRVHATPILISLVERNGTRAKRFALCTYKVAAIDFNAGTTIKLQCANCITCFTRK